MGAVDGQRAGLVGDNAHLDRFFAAKGCHLFGRLLCWFLGRFFSWFFGRFFNWLLGRRFRGRWLLSWFLFIAAAGY
jgi:hypothetical protein